jgi:hypothetical protein
MSDIQTLILYILILIYTFVWILLIHKQRYKRFGVVKYWFLYSIICMNEVTQFSDISLNMRQIAYTSRNYTFFNLRVDFLLCGFLCLANYRCSRFLLSAVVVFKSCRKRRTSRLPEQSVQMQHFVFSHCSYTCLLLVLPFFVVINIQRWNFKGYFKWLFRC